MSKIVLGDDPISSREEDFFGFQSHAEALANTLYTISQTSSVCCGIIGGWGSGKTSFLKIMNNYVQDNKEWKAISVRLVAWDTGQVSNLGDSFLYQIFKAVNDDSNGVLKKQFEKLESTLGLRKTPSDMIKGILTTSSELEVVSEPAKSAFKLGASVIEAFYSSPTIRNAFEKLKEHLIETKKTLFIFIDDLDRATGEQIKDILSYLKLYLNQKKIVAVLAYDEEYVLIALQKQLPENIDPRKYMEKIITIKKNIPAHTIYSLRQYANSILTDLKPDIEVLGFIRSISVEVCNFNPRLLKRILLSFIQHLPPEKSIEGFDIMSLFLVVAVMENGLLDDDIIMMSLLQNDLTDFLRRIRELSSKYPLNTSFQGFQEFEIIEKVYNPDVLNYIGLFHEHTFRVIKEDARTVQYLKSGKHIGDFWKVTFHSLFLNLINKGLTIPEECFKFPKKDMLVPPSHLVNKLPTEFDELGLMEYSELYVSDNLNVLIIPIVFEKHDFFQCWRNIKNTAPLITVEKELIIWVVEIINILDDEAIKEYDKDINNISNGLKNKIELFITSRDEVTPLIQNLIELGKSE